MGENNGLEMPQQETLEQTLKRLEGERLSLQQSFDERFGEKSNTLMMEINEFVNSFTQPQFDREKNLEETESFYLNKLDGEVGKHFIDSTLSKFSLDDLKAACTQHFKEKILLRRIQALINEIEALKRTE